MIDINTEHLVSFTQATKTLPARRCGKRPHVATMYRWALYGCKGVRLETVQIGGTKCTSIEALQRFFNRLSNGLASSDLPVGMNLNAPARIQTSRSVERELDAEGL
jgi:hypothetical protein